LIEVCVARRVLSVVCPLLCLLALAAPATAQLTEATLTGTVTDRTGQGIPYAVVALIRPETGLTRETTADIAGTFTASGLPPGTYDVRIESTGFRPARQTGLRLGVGQTTINVRLELAALEEAVTVSAAAITVATSTEARLADSFTSSAIQELPIAQRDIIGLTRLSAGATLIPGAANSTKLSSSPVVTVNGNRYRGNNYVLDGAMNSNPNNSGEPAIVPALESVDEVQVQTLNFGAEFGRGNGSVVNVRTRSGSNQFRGRAWEYHRGTALNAKNYFATTKPEQNFNQFGANLGGPLVKDRTFFFVNYEGSRDKVGRPYAFQVETPELRNYVFATAPDSVAAQLLRQFPAPTPLPGINDQQYADQRNLATPFGAIPAIGRAQTIVDDDIRSHQYIARVDHALTPRDQLSARWIAEYQTDRGGTSAAPATLGRAMRGSRGPFDGAFGNLNLGYMRVAGRAVNDLRASLALIDTTRGSGSAVVPTVTITGITAPFGDVFLSGTGLRTIELRDVLTREMGRHAIRVGGEVRRIIKNLAIGPATSGTFAFNSIADFVADRPFRQTLTVDPATGDPVGFPRHFTQTETGVFIQDQWTINPRVSLSLGVRHDYFGTVTERDGLLSSVVLGPGATFAEQVASASVGRVDQLYTPQRLNVSPRVGIAIDPFGRGRTSIRGGFSRAYQPHHGQSISGARALPPDALQGVIQPSTGIGTRILYGIPVPYNPEFSRGLNAQGGVISRPGEPPIRTTGFVVNPIIRTQYTDSWFTNTQQRIAEHWMVELGYVGTRGVDLERIDDVNRFAGDLLDGREDRLNPNFSVLLFVTNGVRSRYDAATVEVRRDMHDGFALQANYRYSRWLDTSSDTSTGQFQDNSEPGKGAQDVACLQCEWGRSLFDIPHRLSVSATWMPPFGRDGGGVLAAVVRNWQISGVLTAQSGRPFSVWNGAAFAAGGDYNADGGGGAVGGGFYDRPNAPAPGSYRTDWSTDDFLNGLFDASIFPKPAPGTNGTLGRNTFRGPDYRTVDLNVTRSLSIGGHRQLQVRADIFNALNRLNLLLPNADLSLSNFGKSTQAFDARVVQLGVRVLF
jgi:hypothetical protein